MSLRVSRLAAAALAAAAGSLLVAACGSSTGPSSATVISQSTGSVGPVGATVTITNSVASPKSVTIAVGQSVTFINNDNRSHEVASDPHPQHGSCPAMEQGLGTIPSGQTRTTFGFATAGTCHYHDHQDATNAGLQGTIVIQ